MTFRLPNLLIIGVQKGGTTWLYSQLGRHPEIFFSKKKELQFFGRPESKRSMAAYAANFADAGTRRYAGEATASYFWTYDPHSKFCDMNPRGPNVRKPEAVRDILGPDVKLVLSLRHPVHRAVSAFIHHYKRERVDPAENLLEQGTRNGIIDMGFYRHHLRRWEEAFGPDKISTVFIDDIRKDGSAVLQRVFGYLDLPPVAIEGAENTVHGGLKLGVVDGALTVDVTDTETRDLIRRNGLSEARLPRVRREDILGLQQLYQNDIEFIEDRFNRRDLGWRAPPKLEDFLHSS